MSDPIVVYDPVKELAALVDPNTRTAFGPAHIGPDAEAVLDGFLLSIPYDVTTVDSDTLRSWFERYTGGTFPAPATPPAEDTQVAAEQDGNSGVDGAALAEREAAATSGDPPPPQPADTDMEADEGTADTVTEPTPPPPVGGSANTRPGQTVKVPCPACNASGSVPSSEPGVSVTCNLCHGTTRIEVPA